MMKKASINFQGTTWEQRHRKLWQGLFNFYRSYGADLNDLDNLLIDLENCREILLAAREEKKVQHALFGFNWANFQTTWELVYNLDDVKPYLESTEFDYVLLLEVTEDRAILDLKKIPDQFKF